MLTLLVAVSQVLTLLVTVALSLFGLGILSNKPCHGLLDGSVIHTGGSMVHKIDKCKWIMPQPLAMVGSALGGEMESILTSPL